MYFLYLSSYSKSRLIQNTPAILASRTVCGENGEREKKNNYSLAHFSPDSPLAFPSPSRFLLFLRLYFGSTKPLSSEHRARVSINPPTAEPSVVIRPRYSRASPRLTVAPTPEFLPRHLVFASNTSVLVFLPPSRVNTQTRATSCNSQELPFTRGLLFISRSEIPAFPLADSKRTAESASARRMNRRGPESFVSFPVPGLWTTHKRAHTYTRTQSIRLRATPRARAPRD